MDRFSILPGSIPAGDEASSFSTVSCGREEKCSRPTSRPGAFFERRYTPDTSSMKNEGPEGQGHVGLGQGRSQVKAPKPQAQRCYRRKVMRVKREVLLRWFLKEYGFVDPCKPAKKTLFSAISPKEFFFPKEVFYPIHLAAHLGDAELVRTLLARGADPEQKSSKGQTPSDIARAANRVRWLARDLDFLFFYIFPENSPCKETMGIYWEWFHSAHFLRFSLSKSKDMVLMLLVDKVAVLNFRDALALMEPWCHFRTRDIHIRFRLDAVWCQPPVSRFKDPSW